MIKRAYLRWIAPMDRTLLHTTLFLVLFSLIVLYSASGGEVGKVLSQVRNLGLAFLVMGLVARTNPHILERLAFPLYGLALLALIAVALFGEVSHGARRWLHLGPLHVQPSELMKLALPMALAAFFEWRARTRNWRDFVVAALMVLVPVGLVLRQPDLGTALLIASSGFYILYFAGLPWKVMGLLGALALAALPLLWPLLHGYQKKRILIFLDPTQDPLGAGYHTLQAMIAIGSGGVLGKGWLQGTQSHLDFLPEHTTDFIFAVFGEEFGLVGELVFLGAMLVLITRGFYIANEGSTPFSRLMAGALSMTLFTYTFVNMGMVSGILPVVGVPLPFLSYGGTSLVTLFSSVGFLMSVHHHRKLVKQ
ncbi:MAG: rod shape-determining protein RodA [Ferrovum sp.]|jgi:rod shape determining protein RodA|uniref:rod shape-determining protein RodA n=1 Tax=Ferrovum sp. TaxID=2609467 RepID=UPI002604F540|nr:rod shape-determining protein RodA [Ferrovum sp.]MBW8067251.1 rod shape-determining protein RodA [Ferrovum sp.]